MSILTELNFRGLSVKDVMAALENSYFDPDDEFFKHAINDDLFKYNGYHDGCHRYIFVNETDDFDADEPLYDITRVNVYLCPSGMVGAQYDNRPLVQAVPFDAAGEWFEGICN